MADMKKYPDEFKREAWLLDESCVIRHQIRL